MVGTNRASEQGHVSGHPLASGIARTATIERVKAPHAPPAPRQLGVWRGIALVAALSLAVRLWLLWRGVPPLDSDEAVVGLMAHDILGGARPVFFWGQQYMGSLEPTLVALLFALAPATAFTLRLVPIAASSVAVAQVYLLGRRVTSHRVALWAAAYCAVGAPVYVLWMVRARGGYPEMIVLGQTALLLALRGRRPGWRGALELGLLGLVAGLGFWTDPLVMSYLAAALLVFWLQRRLPPARPWREVAPAVGGFAVGAAPLLSGGALIGLATSLVTMSAAGSFTGANRTMTPWHWLLLQLGRPVATAVVSAPLLVGGWIGGVHATDTSVAAFWAQVAQAPLPYAISLALALAGVMGVVGEGWRAARRLRADRRAGRPATPSALAAAALACVALCATGLFQLHSGELFADPRYLLPVVSAAALAAAWWARQARRLATCLTRWRMRAAADTPGRRAVWIGQHRRLRLALLLGGGATLLLWNALALAALTPQATAAVWWGRPVLDDTPTTIAAIEAAGVRCVQVGDYWLGYRLAFESGERIIPIIMHGSAPEHTNQYLAYLRQPSCAQHMAYVELAGTPPAAARHTAWRTGAYPGYTLLVTGQYDVYVPPPQGTALTWP